MLQGIGAAWRGGQEPQLNRTIWMTTAHLAIRPPIGTGVGRLICGSEVT
jgi:hypothetical protein